MILTRRWIVLTALILAGAAAFAAAQATQPVSKTTVNLGLGFLIDIPAGWVRAEGPIISSAFSPRSGAVVTAVLHPAGSRPTDLPYALTEVLPYGGGFTNPTATQQRQFAQQVADFYATSFNPPSKADRYPLYKSSKVSPVSFDPATSQFSFTVTAKYDIVGEYVIEVSGAFGPRVFVVNSIWSEADFHTAHASEILAMRDSIRLGTLPNPAAKVGIVLKRTAQIGVLLAVVLLAIIQARILLKARRERKAEEMRLLSTFDSSRPS